MSSQQSALDLRDQDSFYPDLLEELRGFPAQHGPLGALGARHGPRDDVPCGQRLPLAAAVEELAAGLRHSAREEAPALLRRS